MEDQVLSSLGLCGVPDRWQWTHKAHPVAAIPRATRFRHAAVVLVRHGLGCEAVSQVSGRDETVGPASPLNRVYSEVCGGRVRSPVLNATVLGTRTRNSSSQAFDVTDVTELHAEYCATGSKGFRRFLYEQSLTLNTHQPALPEVRSDAAGLKTIDLAGSAQMLPKNKRGGFRVEDFRVWGLGFRV